MNAHPTSPDSETYKPSRLAPRDMLGLGFLGLRTSKARAALSALGISIGIATLVIVTTIPASSQQALEDKLAALGTNRLRAAETPRMKPPVPLPKGSVNRVQRVAPVQVAGAVGKTESTVNRNGRIPDYQFSGLRVLASRLGLLEAIGGHMRHGEFLGRATGQFPTVVLGHVAAQRLGIPRLRPGEPPPQILIDNHWFSVIGILEPLALYPEIDRAVLVGWGPAQNKLGFDGHPSSIYLQADEPVLEEVRSVLPETINPERPDAVRVTRPSEALAAKRAAETTFSALFLGLAGVALLVGGVGVANIMIISVLERRREIGVRRALGATRGQIRGQFLTESVMLAGLGGVIGVALGALGAFGYVIFQGWPFVVPVEALLGGISGAVVVGVLAGLYPAVRASRLPPTEALASS